MQNNPEPGPEHSRWKDENVRLLSENAQLRKDLEKELLYHKNLFLQWKELNETALVKDHQLAQLKGSYQKGVTRAAFYSVLGIVVLLAALNTYYLFFTTENKNKLSASTTVMIDSLPVAKFQSKEIPASLNQPVILTRTAKENVIKDSVNYEEPVSSAVSQITIKDDQASLEKASAAINEKNKGHGADTLVQPKEKITQSAHDTTALNGSLGLYKIRSKAYLYNNPDENSRRNTFIIQWDSASGTLTALDEKNGFIYIEFKNHLGQLSKGWVRKSDLDRI